MNDEKIKELLSEPSSRNLGLLLLAQTMGDPVRDYELLSSCRDAGIKVAIFAAVYGTRFNRTTEQWNGFRDTLPYLSVLTLTAFKRHIYHTHPTSGLPPRYALFNELGPELDCEEDMIAGNPPKFLAHLFE